MEDPRLDGLTLPIECLKLHHQVLGPRRIVTEEKLQSHIGVIQPADGIEARPDDKTHLTGSNRPIAQPEALQQSRKTPIGATGEEGEALFGQDPVFPLQRDHIRDSPQGH